MTLSIRSRLFLNIVIIMAPMCFFVWLLVQEVQTQINFSMQERKGVALQKPLTELLHQVQQRKLALLQNTLTPPQDSTIAKLIETMNDAARLVATDVGFASQPLTDGDKKNLGVTVANGQWGGAISAVLASIQTLPKDNSQMSIDAYVSTAAALKALISRASDGSNLTLDPDLDSYYVMDATSFALPNTIDDLANAEADMLSIIQSRSAAEVAHGLLPERFAKIKVWENTLQSVDTARIIGSFGTALAEDGNFNGISPTLSSLTPLIKHYEDAAKELATTMDALTAPGRNISAEELSIATDKMRTALVALYDKAAVELPSLLLIREASLKEHLKGLLVQGCISLAAGLVLFWLVARSITVPITRLNNVMMTLASGNTNVDVKGAGKRHELGKMASAVVVFKQNAEFIQKLAKDFETSVQHVVDVVASAATEMDAASRNVNNQAQQSHSLLTKLSVDVVNVTDNIQSIATTGEELTAAINEISGQVQKSNATTDSAADEATHMRKVAEELSKSASQVSGIVEIINGIAAKINLLSLNATIEAARAGEAGKGFSVVASEVKALANQTAAATAEIGALVTNMQESSNLTLEAVTQIIGVIDQMTGISSTIAAAVEEQGVATREIVENIVRASDRITNVKTSASVITDTAAQSAAASSQTLQAAGELSKQAETLRSDVRDFMKKLVG